MNKMTKIVIFKCV